MTPLTSHPYSSLVPHPRSLVPRSSDDCLRRSEKERCPCIAVSAITAGQAVVLVSTESQKGSSDPTAMVSEH